MGGGSHVTCDVRAISSSRVTENGYIESFNGKLRDEFLNVEVFFTLVEARKKLHGWRRDYNHQRPHSALADHTPAGVCGNMQRGKSRRGSRLGKRCAFTTFAPHGCGSNKATIWQALKPVA